MSPFRVASGRALRALRNGSLVRIDADAITPSPVLPRLTMTNAGMVQRSGVNFRTGGANAFQLIHNDYPSSRLMSRSEIDSILDKAVAIKAGVLRVHTLGVNVGVGSNFLVTGVSGTGSNPTISYNAAVWDLMDYAIAAAAQRGIYLMVPMVDELGYYHGGKRTWVNFRRPGTVSLDYNVKASNSSTQRTAENFFYTDTQILADFDKYIAEWLNHVNPYTGRAYKDEPAIGVIELGNELWTAAQDAPTWAAARAQKIKAIAPNLLVADGSAADGQILNTTSLDSPYIDIFGTHPYTTYGANNVTAQAIQAATKGKAYHVGEYGWSKASAPDIEAAARNAGNTFFTAFWSLQNDADLHNAGAGYGIDDASFYVPGKDSTQQAANTRVTAHSQALIDGAASAVPPTASSYADDFTGTNGAAPNTTRWTTSGASSGSTTQIQNNAARMTTSAVGGYGGKAVMVSLAPASINQRIAFDLTPTDRNEAYFQISLRSAAQDGSIGDVTAYRAEVDVASGSVSIARRGSNPTVVAPGVAIPGWAAGVTTHFEYAVIGTSIQLWAWTTGNKPTSPLASATNSDVPGPGYIGFVLNGGNAAAARSMTVDAYVPSAS